MAGESAVSVTFTPSLTPSLSEAVERLASTRAKLKDAIADLAFTRTTEQRERVNAWITAIPPASRDSSTYRNNAASFHTYGLDGSNDYSSEVMQLQADVDALRIEFDYLKVVISAHLAALVGS